MKTIVLGVTGGIAAYKACDIASRLRKLNYNVIAVMTKNSAEFITKTTLETVTANRVYDDVFDRNFSWDVSHVSLAKKADLMLIAPATANVIAKLNAGFADDMLTTTALAVRCKIIVCPAMNTAMFQNPVFQGNLKGLVQKGFGVVSPGTGMLACGDVGEGRLAGIGDIVSAVQTHFNASADYAGKTVLLTAGATAEDIDGVRFVSNYSSGKMGAALAENALSRGARVVVVAGRVSVPMPAGAELVAVKTTEDMRREVIGRMDSADIIVMAGAPADYRPAEPAAQKLKDKDITLRFVKNPDIAAQVGQRKGDKKLVIFSAETENLVQNAAAKLKAKNADMAVANDVTQEGAGFAGDTNIVTLLYKDGKSEALPLMSKADAAEIILSRALKL